jgi:hypothetical protein
MPGSGGNFLSRCLNFHPDINCFKECVNADYEKKYNMLNYKKIQTRNLKNDNWIEFEDSIGYFAGYNYSLLYNIREIENIKNVIIFSHSGTRFGQLGLDCNCDIRITTYSKEEFNWAIYQALYKNSRSSTEHKLKIGQLYKQKISVPCKNLWDFDLLYDNLTEIEDYLNVEKNIKECRLWQEKLWNEWKTTWASEKFKKKILQLKKSKEG